MVWNRPPLPPHSFQVFVVQGRSQSADSACIRPRKAGGTLRAQGPKDQAMTQAGARCYGSQLRCFISLVLMHVCLIRISFAPRFRRSPRRVPQDQPNTAQHELQVPARVLSVGLSRAQEHNCGRTTQEHKSQRTAGENSINADATDTYPTAMVLGRKGSVTGG